MVGAAADAEALMNERPKIEGGNRLNAMSIAELTAWSQSRTEFGTQREQVNPFVLPDIPPGVLPDGMGMDEYASGYVGAGGIGTWAAERMGLFGDFGMPAFIGFAPLAALSQKAEFRRISETLATEMTRKWIKFTAGSDGDKGNRLDKIEKEFARLNVQNLFRVAAEHDGFFGRAHIFIDIEGNRDPTELATPIGTGTDAVSKAKVRRGTTLSLKNIEPVWVQPNDYASNDPLDESFYKPQTWFIFQRRVHTSRLCTFVGRPVSDTLKPAYSFGGVSMTQLARTYVENWEHTRDSVARLVNAFSILGLKTKLAEAMNAGGDGGNLMRRVGLFTNFRNNQGMLVLDDEEEFFNVNIPLSTLDELQAQSQEHMAAVSGIPLVKLLGISPHGLNASSEGEIRVFYDWIKSFQERLFKGPLKTILAFVQLSLFGQIDDDISFQFEDLWSSSEMEKAQVREANANTDKTYIEGGVVSALEVRKKVARDHDMPYAGLELEEAPLLSEMEKAENATKMATPILQAFSEGIIDKGQALEELVENGVFKTITEQDIQDAKDEPPELDDQMLTDITKTKLERGGHLGQDPMQAQAQQAQQFNQQQAEKQAPPPGAGGDPVAPRRPPNLKLVGDERYDFGKLSKIDVERLLAAIREGDQYTVERILSERELYRPATGRGSDADRSHVGDAAGFTVYHGTPFDFDHFSAEHEGSGTGRSVYGEGIYTASNPDVAEWYRDELSDRAHLAGKPLLLNAALTHLTGHVYTVRVHRARDEFINWDEPADAQSPKVANALKRVLGTLPTNQSGRDIVKRMTGDEAMKLARAGVAGIAYKNHEGHVSTRPGGGENYVLFDPDDLDIVEKDYKPVTQDEIVYDFTDTEARAPKGTTTGGQWVAGGANPSKSREDERVSTRIPTAKKGGQLLDPTVHKKNDLRVGLESSRTDPEQHAARAKLIRTYGNMRHVEGESDDDTTHRFIEHVKSNVLALHDAYKPELRGRAKLWYVGANKIAHDWAKEYGLEPRAVAGAMASLSPQRDWFKNVSLARRVIDTLHHQKDQAFTPQSKRWAENYVEKVRGEGKDKEAAAIEQTIASFAGKKLSDIKDPLHRALWVRSYDQAHNDRTYPVVTPEGAPAEKMLNDPDKKGNRKPSTATWGTMKQIANAIACVDNPDLENISKTVGGNHKVRNFYNNIIAPHSNKEDVTIDTHAIGAGLLRAIGGSSPEAGEGLGMKGPKDAATGTKGLYGLYAEAYRRAAKERKLLPREMQSITWEAVRGLFGQEVKGKQGLAVQKQIKDIWDGHRNGEYEQSEAQRRLLALNGGIKDPSWHRPRAAVHDGQRDTDHAGGVHFDQLDGRDARSVDARGRGRAAGVPAGRGRSAGDGRDLAHDAEAWETEPRVSGGANAGEWTASGGSTAQEDQGHEHKAGPARVYSVGHKSGELTRGGNLRAIAAQLANSGAVSASHINAHEVDLPENEKDVGRKVQTHSDGQNAVTYKFPAGTQAKHVGSIPIEDFEKELAKAGYEAPDEAGHALTHKTLSSMVAEKERTHGPAESLLMRNGYPDGDDEVQQHAEHLIKKHGLGDRIAQVKQKLASGLATDKLVSQGGHKLEDGSYTPERQQLHNKILKELFSRENVMKATPEPGKKPVMTILGGRGGSGKSWLTSDEGPVDRNKTLVIDADHFKSQLPEYQGWNAGLVHEESSDLVDSAAKLAKQLGINVTFDQTMKSGSSAPKRMAQFEDTHELHGHYMHAAPHVAADRALGRYKGGGEKGRFVPPEFVLGAHGNEKNFDDITSKLHSWSIYDNNGARGAPKLLAKGGKNAAH
jgi:phage-related protein (TIGR01555 family)